jgi:predicted permease
MRGADLYRLLLWCYPAPFRQEYGVEMRRAFAAELGAARQDGPIAGAAIWGRALLDLIPTAFREHRHVLTQDLRHAIRVLRGSPGFTAVAIASLALGIGANAAIFSLLNNVLFATLPVRDPQALVLFTDPDSTGVGIGSQRGERALMTYQEFLDLQRGSTALASAMAASSSLHRVQARLGAAEPEEIALSLVSTSYFETLGVSPSIGRAFGGAHEPAEGSVPFAVISHELWQRRFGGRADVIGKAITLGDAAFQVIGVAPSSFFGQTVGQQPDAWLPLANLPAILPGRPWLHDVPGTVEKVMWLHVFGRLRPGATADVAAAEANVTFQQGLSRYYGTLPDQAARQRFLDQRLRVRPAAAGASTLSDFANPLLVLLGGAGLVLLIACANLGNLLLARTTARAREVAVRLALGAGRGRLVRQLLTESLCLAVAGGICGLVLAVGLRAVLLRLLVDPIALPAPVDWRVALFVFALTLLVGLMLGLLPAFRITAAPMATGLRDQGRGIAGSAAWLRIGRLVVVGQLALSLPLLVGAGLLARTLVNLQRADLGYPRDGLLTVGIDAHAAGYEPARQAHAFEALLDRIRAVPGVRAASFSNNGLFGGSDSGDEVIVEGYTRKGDGDRGSSYDAVGPGYFSTLGIAVMAGREITGQDRVGGAQVCVINETFARRFFAGRHPIGLHVTQRYADQSRTYQVVGVVRDSRQNRLRGPIEHRFYTPATQPASNISEISYIIRPRGDAAAVLAEVRRVIQAAEPRMTVTRAVALDEAVGRRLSQDRMMAQLSIAFGVVAALLAALGLYGVLSYGVARRTQELGVRKALGARHATLMTMILRETGWLLAGGLIAGGALSAGAVQLIASRLYGLSPADPATFALALVVLSVVAMVATWLPAYRASRVDPLVALRAE